MCIRYRYKIRKYLKELDNKYSFSENDVYIFQDIESANEFIRMFPFRNTLFVYHQQGSLYNEWRSFNSYELSTYKRYLNQYSAKAYDNVAVLGFPSNGAKESLLESEPYFEKSVNKRETKVLYNGFTKPESLPNNLSLETEYIYSKLRGFDGIVFCTVSALNEAKAVERIPQYLTQVKKKHKIKWIVVGNGIKSEELQQEINKYNLSENVIWQKHPLSHAEILKLFELTDFYIMFHRFSIFDYSTIEALAYGCIPVLTPVGGNKEVIFENNGIFVDDFGNCDSFENFVSSKDIPTVKKINQEIQNDRFSNYAFLKRYSELVLKLREGRI